MGEDSLDFYDLEGSDLNSATRQFFRVSIGGNEKYFVEIDHKKYPLADISVNGASFFVDSGTTFPIGTMISGCVLGLNKNRIDNLKGKVIHNSSELVDNDHDLESKWLCGLLWENLSSENREVIISGVEILKKDILVKNL